MEACRIPIELCEAIMDTLPDIWSAAILKQYKPGIEMQHTLCACALTCRAWRVRAQLLLWGSPYLEDERRLALFTAAIRTAPKPLITSRLWLHQSTFVSSAELFMHTFPNLRRLTCWKVDFICGPPLPIFRMRLPFFASITVLQLVQCKFSSWRAVLDVVWAFPNLAVLDLLRISLKSKPLPAAGGRVDLSVIRGHLRACQKLTKIHWTFFYADQDPPPSFTGSVFGSAVTELDINFAHDLSYFIRFLSKNSFPSLRSIAISTWHSDEVPGVPYLHVIAASRAVPGILKKIVMRCDHGEADHRCCQANVGTSEEVAGSPQELPALLSGLEELTIQFIRCEDPGPCAAYIHSILPSMRNVLRFEHSDNPFVDPWKEHTLPATDSE